MLGFRAYDFRLIAICEYSITCNDYDDLGTVVTIGIMRAPANGSSAHSEEVAMSKIDFRALCGIAAVATALLANTDAVAQYPPSPQPCPCRFVAHYLTQLPDSPGPDTLNPAQFKSENTARIYSLYGTLIPTATLILAYPGLLIGPSTGYFYADQPGRAWKGIGIRALATGGMISSFLICGWDCDGGDPEYGIAWMVFLTSAGTFVGSAIYDIATVEGAVRRHNSQVLQTAWALTPTYSARDRALGLRLKLTF